MKTWKSRELVRLLQKKHGAMVLRQSGSHLIVRVTGTNGTTEQTSVPVHKGRDLNKGLLFTIERDLEAALGKNWLRDEG